MERENIRNCSLYDLQDFCVEIEEKSFRAEQIYNWIWQKGATSFETMSNLSKGLRDKLTTRYYFDTINITHLSRSIDSTVKVLFTAFDESSFEGVLIPGKNRVTACISTQVGCGLNCKFCSTGKLGLKRDLTVGEIFGQVFELNELSKKEYGRTLTNIVIMGMGEPLLNYNNTLGAINQIISEKGLGMSPQRITLSTAGIAPKIKQLADDQIKFNLSISLHTAINMTRSNIMPINNKYNLQALSEAISYFHSKTGKRITYEYLMLNGINDSIKDAEVLTNFTKISPCKINLIEYNSDEKSNFQSSDSSNIEKFVEYLEKKNLVVTIRRSKGQDINAACGQLANKKQ